MYAFVHVTKTGGTALERYFKAHLAEHVRGEGHDETCETACAENDTPILVVRDPFDRFASMYRYWKHGSEAFGGGSEAFGGGGPATASVKDFIAALRDGDSDVLFHADYLWAHHFAPTVAWLGAAPPSAVVVVRYRPDLGAALPALCAALGLPSPEAPLEKINVSGVERVELDDEDAEFVRERFAADLELWDRVVTRPGDFRAAV